MATRSPTFCWKSIIHADNPEGVMERLVHEAIYLKHHPSLQERSEQLAAVTPTKVSELLKHAVGHTTYIEGAG